VTSSWSIFIQLYSLIQRFLAETLTMFCETLGFRGTLVRKPFIGWWKKW